MTEPAGAHILVVEDHHDLRDMICEVLEGSGFRASAAMSADAAMGIVRAGEVAAIVTDIVLAGSRRDGVSFHRSDVRRHVRGPGVGRATQPFVVATGGIA